MSDTAAIITTAITTLGVIIGVAIRQWVQLRTSRRQGVKNDDVQAQPGAQLEPVAGFRSLARELQEEIARLREDRTEDHRQINQVRTDLESVRLDLESVRGELRSVLAEVESIARDLRRFVEWEEGGAHGDPPIALADIYARLEALNRKRPS